MRWSKVRKLVHDSFADSVRNRVQVNVTNFGKRDVDLHCFVDNCRQGWLRVDGKVIAHAEHGRLRVRIPLVNSGRERQVLLFVDPSQGAVGLRGAEVGTSMELTKACWEYLHSSLNDSLRSADPFVSSLAVLNAKVGNTRLRRASTCDLHPLTRAILDFRLDAERLRRPTTRSDASPQETLSS